MSPNSAESFAYKINPSEEKNCGVNSVLIEIAQETFVSIGGRRYEILKKVPEIWRGSLKRILQQGQGGLWLHPKGGQGGRGTQKNGPILALALTRVFPLTTFYGEGGALHWWGHHPWWGDKFLPNIFALCTKKDDFSSGGGGGMGVSPFLIGGMPLPPHRGKPVCLSVYLCLNFHPIPL